MSCTHICVPPLPHSIHGCPRTQHPHMAPFPRSRKLIALVRGSSTRTYLSCLPAPSPPVRGLRGDRRPTDRPPPLLPGRRSLPAPAAAAAGATGIIAGTGVRRGREGSEGLAGRWCPGPWTSTRPRTACARMCHSTHARLSARAHHSASASAWCCVCLSSIWERPLCLQRGGAVGNAARARARVHVGMHPCVSWHGSSVHAHARVCVRFCGCVVSPAAGRHGPRGLS